MIPNYNEYNGFELISQHYTVVKKPQTNCLPQKGLLIIDTVLQYTRHLTDFINRILLTKFLALCDVCMFNLQHPSYKKKITIPFS